MADEQHDNKAKATKRRSGDKKKGQMQLAPVAEESFARPQINKLNLAQTGADSANDIIVHEEKSPVGIMADRERVKGGLSGPKTDVSSPLLERKNPLLDQAAASQIGIRNSPATGKRNTPKGTSPRKTVEIRTPNTERRMKEKGKETEVVETQNPVFNTKREDASYNTATTSVHSSENIIDSASTSNESSRTRMERMIQNGTDRRSNYGPNPIQTPRLRYTPEEDHGLHRPKLAQLGLDQLLNPAVTIQTPRSRPKASVLYSCLPSHLEKDHNKTLNPDLIVWRPESDNNVSKILSLIPFFNETPEELYKTMQSLVKTHRYFVEKKMDACSHGKRLMEPGESCNLHVLVIQDGYKKACPQMNEWLRECFPCKAWDYLAKLQNPGPNGAAMEDMETINWFASRTKRLFRKPEGPSKNKNYYQTRNCPCCQHRNPIEVREYCEACGLHLSNDPLKECVVAFQIVNELHKVIPVTLPHPFTPGQKLTITLTLIVKCRNRQKHDSHWWGLAKDNGWMQAYAEKAEYGFLTDCGTLFHYKCLYHLMCAIIQPNAAAATGRQRVMSPSHQDGSDEGLVSRFFRHVQRCDFELSFGATMGSFACFGFLPVLPGPCGFYRLDYLLACAPFYHDFLSMDVNDIGVIDANLMIAEDRVLSWACFFEPVVSDASKDKEADCCVCLEQVTWDPASDALELEEKNEDGSKKRLEPKKRTSDITIPRDVQTVLAPEAIFYFECETLMMNFVKQRRRWLNGTACGYLWLMYKRPFYPINTPYRPPAEEKPEKEKKRITQSIDYNSSEESREDQASPKKDGDFDSDDSKGKEGLEEIVLDDDAKEKNLEEGPSGKHTFASHLANRWRSLQENTTPTGPNIVNESYVPSSTTTMQWQWRIPWYRRIPIKILVAIQLWMNLWVYLAPAIFIIMFRYALTILAFRDDLLSTYWWVAVLVMYLVFVYVSTGNRFLSWIFYVATLFGMVIECLSMAGIGKSAYKYFSAQANKTRQQQAAVQNGTNGTDGGDGNAFTDAPMWIILVPLIMIAITMFLPIVASCLACPKLFTKFFRSSFWYIITSFIPYFLFLPTLIAVFGAFSLARMFDFSWGNRDSNGSTDKLGARLSELEQRAKFMSPLLVAMNVALVFIIADFSNISPVVLLVWSLLLFGPSMVNIFLSFGYFLWWRITQPCNACC